MIVSRSLIAVAAGLVLTGAAFAASGTKGTLHLYEIVTVQGKQLAPGEYKVEWSGSGPNVQLNIANDKGTVATVPATVVAQNSKNENDGYVASQQPNGTKDLADIFFHGQKFELKINGESANTAPQPVTSGAN